MRVRGGIRRAESRVMCEMSDGSVQGVLGFVCGVEHVFSSRNGRSSFCSVITSIMNELLLHDGSVVRQRCCSYKYR